MIYMGPPLKAQPEHPPEVLALARVYPPGYAPRDPLDQDYRQTHTKIALAAQRIPHTENGGKGSRVNEGRAQGIGRRPGTFRHHLLAWIDHQGGIVTVAQVRAFFGKSRVATLYGLAQDGTLQTRRFTVPGHSGCIGEYRLATASGPWPLLPAGAALLPTRRKTPQETAHA